MNKLALKIRSYILLIAVFIDLFVSGTMALIISILSWNFQEPIYRWAWNWAERARKLFGINVKIIGEENLKKRVPAIFAVTHQSMSEVIMLQAVLPINTRFIGKKSLRFIPIFGLLWIVSKQISLDRSNHASALKSMETARSRLREGYSIFIAPEGTRSPTGTLGKLKKGVYHLALQTKAPIVPITVVNSYLIQPKHSLTVKPGEVVFVIDPPIDTTMWAEGEAEKRIDELRRIYQQNLNRYGAPDQYAPL